MERYFLGIDIGTSAVKVTVCTDGGRITAQASAPCTLRSPQPGFSEEAPEEWWESAVLAVRECARLIEGKSIEGISVTGMVPAVVLLDEAGGVIRPSIQQNDMRAAKEIRGALGKMHEERVFALTGSVFSQQSVGPKLLWLKKHEPQSFARIRAVLGSYDYIGFRLTGTLHVESNWALESGLYDIREERWSEELLSLFEVPSAWMPPVLHTAAPVGKLLPDAAEAMGLTPGTPVTAGAADHVAAAFAAGINREGSLLIKFGSAGDILYHCDQRVLDRRLFIDYHVVPGNYLLNGCMATSGSLHKWFVQGFCAEDRVNAEAQGKNIYAYLDEHAANIPPGSDGVVTLPYFLGEKTPILDPNAKGVFYGLSLYHTRYHLYRSVLEAVCFGFLHHIEILRENGLPIHKVVMSEGGAASALWRQIAADVIGLPVHYLTDNPGASLAAAYIAGMAAGAWEGWDGMNAFVKTQSVSRPVLEHHAAYGESYRVYRELYRRLRGLENSGGKT